MSIKRVGMAVIGGAIVLKSIPLLISLMKMRKLQEKESIKSKDSSSRDLFADGSSLPAKFAGVGFSS